MSKIEEIEVRKTYPTRNGQSVRILATDLKGKYPIAGAILNQAGEEVLSEFQTNGRYRDYTYETAWDIIISGIE